MLAAYCAIKQMKILAIVPYHLDFCAGQRFRIELWAKELANRGIEVEFVCFSNKNLTDTLYQPNQYFKKAVLMLSAFVKQLTRILTIQKPNLIFIYREAALFGPAIIEKIVRRWGIPIVYDIDEPLFVPYVSPSNGILNKLKFFSKVNKLMAMSDTVFSVNQSIKIHALQYNKNVDIVPMTVDLKRYSPSESVTSTVQKNIIVWVGTFTNQANIELIVPALREVKKTHNFEFRIIADVEMSIEGLDINFIPWAYDIEVPNLQEAMIGIAPVKDSVWSPYKFFFKTVQYMSLGMPVVASAVGSNTEIIQDGENGFLAKNDAEWVEKIKILLEDASLRKSMGEKARHTAKAHFDIEKQYDFVENMFKSLAINN
jgi:glycosyltransferase involved in cell wall biosynthesis